MQIERPISFDVQDRDFIRDPYPVFRRMRLEAPIYKHPALGVWILTRRDLVEMVARDPRFTAQRANQILGPLVRLSAGREEAARWERGFFFQDPPAHTHNRGYVSDLFKLRNVEAMRPLISSLVDGALDQVRAEGQMDVPVHLSDPVAMNVLTELLGIPPQDRSMFQHWTVELLKPAGAGLSSEEAGHKVLGASKALYEYVRQLATERWKRPGDDAISHAVAAVDEEHVEQISIQCTDVVIGGYATTINQITNGVLSLLKNPAELDKLRRNRSLFKSATDEILRYEPAVLSISRACREDVEVGGGHVMKEGDLVFGVTAAANRDPDVFPDPDRFDITRPLARHLSFGYGHHHCLGSPLIHLEIQEVLKALLDFPRWELGEGGVEYTHFHLQDRGPSRLHMRFGS